MNMITQTKVMSSNIMSPGTVVTSIITVLLIMKVLFKDSGISNTASFSRMHTQ